MSVVNGILLLLLKNVRLEFVIFFVRELTPFQAIGWRTDFVSIVAQPFPSRWSDGSDNLVRGIIIEQGVCMQAESNPSVWNTKYKSTKSDQN
jgi:hypothetical protein